ncbi:MAG: iron ABC transporter permease [Egibacteraceae bacterium]
MRVGTDTPPAPGVPAPPMPAARRRRSGRPPFHLVLPALLAAGAAALPLAYLVVRAAEAPERVLELLWSPSTAEVVANTGALVALVVVGSLLVGVPMAWLTTSTDLPGRRTWALLGALPLVIPSYVATFAYIGALGPGGLVESTLGIGLPSIYGLGGATLVLVLVSYPYVLLTVRGALVGMDPGLEEASRSLGHDAAQTLRRVTLPLLRPAVGAGSLLVALYVLSDFGAVSLLRFDSFTRTIYTSYRAGFDRTGAVVLALLLVAFTIVLLVVEARVRGKVAAHRVGTGVRRRRRPIALGRWRWPALAFVALVVAVSLLLPVGVLVLWLLRGVAAGEPLRLAAETWVAAWNSVRASALAAAVAVALALPVGVLSVRYRRRATVALERATYLGYALPGIVIALALVFVGARFAGPLYQSLAMLVAAYVVLFLPQAVGAVRASVLQVPPSVEEAARGLGEPGWRVLLRVTTPLVRPGIVAGGALVFLTAMKELPATLLLGPTGDRTLATAIWSATSEAFFARAAAPALVLVLISGIPMAILLRRRHGLGA